MQISFPPGSLSESALIVPVIFKTEACIALAKPPCTGRLCEELREQILAGKPSALALGIKRPQIIYTPEEESSGVLLIADKDSKAFEQWKNELGSTLLNFKFLLLVKPQEIISEDAFRCDLPIAQHFTEARSLISHKTGKKSETLFRRIEKFKDYELWEASTAFPRIHQIRLHAAECGIPIVGENLYADVPAITLSSLRPKNRLNKGTDKAFYNSICLHLESISGSEKSSLLAGTTISAPPPEGFLALLKKLKQRIL